MRIIDMHAHIDVCEPLHWYDTGEKLASLMDEAGVDKAVVSAYLNMPGPDMTCLNRLYQSAKPFGNKFMIFLRLDPWFGEACIRFLEKAVKEYPIKGVKLHPAHYTLYPYGDLTVKLLRKAGDLGLPVLFHCGDEMMCLPLQIGEAAGMCPETTMILAHMGGYAHVKDAVRMAQKYKNIYIDTSEVPVVSSVRRVVKEVGADRVLFGSDAPCCDPMVEIEKVKLAGLSEEEEELVFYKNAVRLMGLEDGYDH